jgi:osmotically-inducible protein OsmY
MKPSIKNKVNLLFFLFLFTALLSITVYAQNEEQNPTSTTKIYVEYRLVKNHLLNNDNITVNVNNNKIILEGNVPTIYDRNKAAEEAGSVNKNYVVVNNIKVISPAIPDSVVTANIMKNIDDNVFYGVFNWINVNYKNGVATLSGWVSSPWLKSQFQEETEKVAGVKEVKNEIKDTFGPGYLGRRAARVIYSDPVFEGMEYMPDPPVHIIVNNNTILLEGRVPSIALSSRAEYLARFLTDAAEVDNHLQIQKNW